MAAGGLGAAGGRAMILTGGTAIVAVAVTGAVMYGFEKWDEAEHAEYVRLTLDRLAARDRHVAPAGEYPVD